MINIFTGYYALISTYVDSGLYPIPISRFIPKFLMDVGLEHYTKLAPPDSLLKKFKNRAVDEEEYEKIYDNEVLSVLNPTEVYNEIVKISDGNPAVLLCYESPEKFCHRHLVSSWFRRAGISSGEFGVNLKKNSPSSLNF